MSSVAARAREIDRADKRDGYQHNYSSEKGVNDHRIAPGLTTSDACGTPELHCLFSMGYKPERVKRSRQKQTRVGDSSQRPSTGTRPVYPLCALRLSA